MGSTYKILLQRPYRTDHLEGREIDGRILKLMLETGCENVIWTFVNMVMDLWVLPQDTANANVNINHLQ
jgi:hypothetical protein